VNKGKKRKGRDYDTLGPRSLRDPLHKEEKQKRSRIEARRFEASSIGYI
jgi:hypothetical protein